jgi:transposase
LVRTTAIHRALTAAYCGFLPGPKLQFLARYPTPAAAAHLGEKRIAAFCNQHGYAGRRPAGELLSRLRAAPAGTLDTAITGALLESSLALVALLRCLNDGIKTLDASIATRLDQHPEGKIFASLPRSGTINAAQMLAVGGDCRDAYDSPDAIAALAGLTPVTKESGITMRSASPGRATNASVRP